MKNSLIIRLALASLMIALGVAIYIISRDNIVFLDWLPKSIKRISCYKTIDDSSKWVYIFKYCLPDGLWYGALLIFQDTFLVKSKVSKYVMYLSLILPFIWEISQIHPLVQGTFDPLDLLTYFIVFLVYTLIRKISTI